ncbi:MULTISPECIES: hypothetical protein [unclassified Bartonella]
MFIKKSLFRSVLIIALFTTCFISTSNGYANSEESSSFFNKLFCSKVTTELKTELHNHLIHGNEWWEKRFKEIRMIEEVYFLHNMSTLSKERFEQHVNMIREWHDILWERNNSFSDLTGSMLQKISAIEDLNKAKQSKNHMEESEILKALPIIEKRIIENKRKLHKLDYESEALYKFIIHFY